MVERLQVSANGDPLGEALHPGACEHLLEPQAAGEHDVHRGQGRGHVGEQPQFLDQPRRQRVGLVDQNHQARPRGGEAADPLDQCEPQVALVDAPEGFPDRGHHGLPEGSPRADARPGQERHVEVVADLLGHLRQ
jgi:hypothetical protein